MKKIKQTIREEPKKRAVVKPKTTPVVEKQETVSEAVEAVVEETEEI